MLHQTLLQRTSDYHFRIARILTLLVIATTSELRLLFSSLFVVAFLGSSTESEAQTAATPFSKTGNYSVYENESIRDALAARKASIELHPEGKRLVGIDVVTLDVIEKRDPLPRIANIVHVKSRDYVIRREVLLRPGQPYQQILVDETARNLRKLPQLSLVVCLPMQGNTPNDVRLLVLTKDVWSLRLGMEFGLTAAGLESLQLEFSETNLLGTQQTVAGRFELYPESYTTGARYVIPRLFGSRVAVATEANVITNRRSGNAEGSFGSLALGQPLFSTLTPWSWNASIGWREEVTRRYVNARLSAFDAKVTPEIDRIPFQYRTSVFANSYAATRSFGWAIKNDFTAGFTVSHRAYALPATAAFDPRAVDEFTRKNVPTSDRRIGPYLEYHTYTTNFVRVLDLETLDLQEDYRLGHDMYLRVYPITEALGSSRTFLGLFAAAQYTWDLSDGLIRIGAQSVTEAQSDRLSDASWLAFTRLVTPRLRLGRFVLNTRWLSRYRNYLNQNSYVGGDGNLRGFPSNFFVGKDSVTYNFEFRTRPIMVFSSPVGAAAFYDVGNAFAGFDRFRVYQSAGVGLRVLFPQFNRQVLRGDIGFPLTRGSLPGVSPVSFYVSFEQAFPVPGVALPL